MGVYNIEENMVEFQENNTTTENLLFSHVNDVFLKLNRQINNIISASFFS